MNSNNSDDNDGGNDGNVNDGNDRPVTIIANLRYVYFLLLHMCYMK